MFAIQLNTLCRVSLYAQIGNRIVTIDSVTSLRSMSHVPHKGFNVFYSTVVYGELALLAVSDDAVSRPSGLVRVLLKTRSQSVVK